MAILRCDQAVDAGFHKLHQYIRLYDFPAFAKQAQLADIVDPPEPHARKYADVRLPYQFPCHTKAATFVSHIYFLEHQDQINPKVRSEITERLDKFAAYWQITRSVDVLKAKHAALQAEASQQLPDDSYALVWYAGGAKERHYPLRNGLEVKAAAEWYETYQPQLREQFSFLDRQTIAAKILDKAASMGAAIDGQRELLERAAGRGYCDPKQASRVIKGRLLAATRITSEERAGMGKLAEAVVSSKNMALDPAAMSQLAHTLDLFDRSHGLLNKYSETFLSPEDACFAVTYEQARGFSKDACTTATGSVYDRNEFTQLSRSDLRDLFGEELVRDVSHGLSLDPVKLGEVAAGFARPEAQLFEQLLREKGVLPLAKEASGGLGFTFTQLAAMAELA